MKVHWHELRMHLLARLIAITRPAVSFLCLPKLASSWLDALSAGARAHMKLQVVARNTNV